jgi:hypothetical protein
MMHLLWGALCAALVALVVIDRRRADAIINAAEASKGRAVKAANSRASDAGNAAFRAERGLRACRDLLHLHGVLDGGLFDAALAADKAGESGGVASIVEGMLPSDRWERTAVVVSLSAPVEAVECTVLCAGRAGDWTVLRVDGPAGREFPMVPDPLTLTPYLRNLRLSADAGALATHDPEGVDE